MRAVALMEHAGVPIDVETLDRLRVGWEAIQDKLISEVDSRFGVFDGRSFRAERWADWLARHGIAWPRLESGELTLDDDTFRVTGDLTVKGVTKPVIVDLHYTGAALDPFGNQRIGLEGEVKVNRKDWGLNWNATLETGGVLVSEKVTLEFDISAIKSES